MRANIFFYIGNHCGNPVVHGLIDALVENGDIPHIFRLRHRSIGREKIRHCADFPGRLKALQNDIIIQQFPVQMGEMAYIHQGKLHKAVL